MAGVTIIYVVDDDEAVRDSLEAVLLSGEFDAAVECYGSGTEFLEAVNPQANGCVLLDVRMPDMSGLEVQSRLQGIATNLAVVIITGHGEVPMAVEAMRAGAFHFIAKPFVGESLLQTVADAIEDSRVAQREWLSRHDAQERLARLTSRERDVLRLLVAGRLNKVIAYELGISARTVEVHRARVMEKLQVRSLSEAVRLTISAKADDLLT